ncbi:ubiquinone biosynthesis monooxygenase COQ6, mitochondrial isoform X3 [Harpegnathos saltator]|uniref:Ubiquinone biosynthesis monooxygenase COQ6, mitochondrial n=1 Tax=Harpegnathos saltator TaxID=610380 RepID=E2C8K8_HARSA|nr:ubiquinone biosynthesis monooxygenase COQ6, mitochondrial isoform X3 [Harpegnathos saltator]XP_025158865.1 ubiquinone biosynthesis monooxygenase COQ6, mitochondrial isoform X3 [Harpegnathos saltator]XP_025158866.1 ubiquinone biosynthesis monooxygenase COQ6, mitochondrial isoform X3 [Harpegnathos saltator]EFN75738.1 Ubiquinone biosynthesis monooxygenase COQ6 [Harpegnathos saltator]
MVILKEVFLSRIVFSSLSQKFKYIISNAAAVSKKNYSTTAGDEESYDIIVTGGGMIGTTMACSIANNRRLEGKKVLLLEGSNKHEYTSQQQYSNRVVALNQQTRILLSSLGAWQHIEAVRYCPVKKMQVWDACSDAMITFNEDYLYEELAYIVENDLLLHAVNKQLSQKENVTTIYNSKVADIKLPNTSEEYSTIQLQSGKRYKASLLVGADGVNSLVRKAMGVVYPNWQYDQLAIVATLKLSEPTENIVAWQRFLPTGPIALLPLTDSLSSLVWCVPTKEAKNLLKVTEEEFVDKINEALWKVYPKNNIVESGMAALRQLLQTLSLQTGVSRQLPPSVASIVEGSRAAFPLGFGHSASYVRLGAVLIGDAAHRVHPLAGQGVNLGFGDVTVLTKLLAEATVNGCRLNDLIYLRQYETQRQCHNTPTMFTIDALHRLYQGTAAPIVLARSLGLQLVNAVPQIKKMLMEQAAGGIVK